MTTMYLILQIGTINGIFLGLENYIQKHKSGDEGIIVNTSSIAGVSPFSCMPTYTASKFAVHGMTCAWGKPIHFNRTKVRVVGICPGATKTPMIAEENIQDYSPAYTKVRFEEFASVLFQEPEIVGEIMMKIIEKAPSGSMWVVEGGEAAYQYEMPDRFTIPRTYL